MKKPEQSGLFGGWWWRFRGGMEIRNGAIRPKVPDSLERYDAWDVYEKARRENNRSPYQTLTDPPARGQTEAEHAVAWCSDYGPLGFALSPGTADAAVMITFHTGPAALNHSSESLTEVIKKIRSFRLLLENASSDDRSRRWLEAQAAPCRLHLVAGKAGFEPRFTSPTLWASLAMMALQDLLSKKRVFACARCGKIATTTDSRKSYCTRQCADSARKTKSRRKHG